MLTTCSDASCSEETSCLDKPRALKRFENFIVRTVPYACGTAPQNTQIGAGADEGSHERGKRVKRDAPNGRKGAILESSSQRVVFLRRMNFK